MALIHAQLFAGVAVGSACGYGYFGKKPVESVLYGIVQGVAAVAIRELFGKTVGWAYITGLTVYFIGSEILKYGNALLHVALLDKGNTYRKTIYLDTMKLIHAGRYISPEGNSIVLTSGEELSRRSRAIHQDPPVIHSKYPNTRIHVVQQDCLDIAQEYVDTGHMVAVVNFAAHDTPGGRFDQGTNGQEENLCYRSELAGFMEYQMVAPSLEQESFYPLENCKNLDQDHLIHTPDVQVFRANSAHSYALLNHPFRIGVISSAAPIGPSLQQVGDTIDYDRPEDGARMKSLILMQLKAAFEGNYDTIILGAFGCGYYGNPPHGVARIYKEAISEYFQGAFQHIVFAILEDPQSKNHHNPHGNLQPFQDCFSNDN